MSVGLLIIGRTVFFLFSVQTKQSRSIICEIRHRSIELFKFPTILNVSSDIGLFFLNANPINRNGLRFCSVIGIYYYVFFIEFGRIVFSPRPFRTVFINFIFSF